MKSRKSKDAQANDSTRKSKRSARSDSARMKAHFNSSTLLAIQLILIDQSAMTSLSPISEPFDLLRLSLSEQVFVKLRGDRELRGTLHAYDGHGNLVLANVEETIWVVEDEEAEGGSEKLRSIKRKSEMLFVRGDGVILVSSRSD